MPEERPDTGRPVDLTGPVRLLLRDLRSSATGLSRREAARRLVVHGANELRRTRRRSWLREVADQLVHPLALLLWLAALLSLLISAQVLCLAIVLVILLNAGFAFVQERQGEQAVEALQAYLPPVSTVIRDGRRTVVPAVELVPGDVVVLAEGDRVCADARLLSGSLEVDTSALTGEVLPAFRSAAASDPGTPLLESPNLVFSGTSCLAGDATAVVVRTGMQTELGRIATLTQRVDREPSPLELQVRRVAWLIAVVAVGVGLAFVPIGWGLAGLTLAESVVFAVGLLVANVPEGLLPTITLALAAGVRELARHGALVRRLSAVETLGSTSVICTDKTGTLTENRMRAVLAWSAAGEHALTAPLPGGRTTEGLRRLAEAMARCNGATVPDGDDPGGGDPTEVALVVAAGELGFTIAPDARVQQRRALFHFDPGRRLMSTTDVVDGGHLRVHTKGAPEEVLARCNATLLADGDVVPLDDATRQTCSATASAYAARGLRVLAAGERRVDAIPSDRDSAERDLTFLGLVALFDPPRPEVAAAVGACHAAGVRVIVITGDHRLTAAEVSRQVGIAGEHPTAVDAATVDDMSDDHLDAWLAEAGEVVIARSSPETKMRVADALQEQGQVVAMTGDGVNDAPALRQADIGIAMGRRGTDVAREAATMVLTDDDFGTIAVAIAAGRRVYDNVRKFILYIFAHATPEVVPFLVFALSGGRVPLPITVLQILAIDIGTETLPALALGREPAEPDVMTRPPRDPAEPLLRKGLLLRAWLLLGGVSALLVLGGFLWVLVAGGWTLGADVSSGGPLHHTWQQATTMTFLGIVACQVGTAFAARTERASLWRIGLLSNRLLLWGIAFELVFAALLVVLPGVSSVMGMAAPPGAQLAVLPVFPVVVWAVDELARAVRRRSRPEVTPSAGPQR